MLKKKITAILGCLTFSIIGLFAAYTFGIGFYLNSSFWLNEKNLVKIENATIKKQDKYIFEKKHSDIKKYATLLVLEESPELRKIFNQRKEDGNEKPNTFHFNFLEKKNYENKKATFYFNPSVDKKGQPAKYIVEKIVVQDGDAYGLTIDGQEVRPVVKPWVKWVYLVLAILSLEFALMLISLMFSVITGRISANAIVK